jgi:hypothetical protein
MLARTLRFLAALSLLAMGAVHHQQYIAGYSSIPTIGVLFLLNAIGGAVLGLGLVFPLAAVLRSRSARLATTTLAITGAAMALASLIALVLSEDGTLFGFHEAGSGAPITVAIAAELSAVITATSLAVISSRRPRSKRRKARPATTWSSGSSIGRT